MAAFISLLSNVLLALTLVKAGHAQGVRPTLNLFAGGGNEATVYFVVGDGERAVSLVTNPNGANIVSDPDSNVTAVDFLIQGAQSGSEILTYALPPGYFLNLIGESYNFAKLSSQSLPSDFSFLSTVKYQANLSISAISQPARNITVTAYDAGGVGPSSVIHLVFIPPTLFPPVFSASTYYTKLFQNTSDGSTVAVNISAVDPAGWPVTYSIQQSTLNNAFVINPLTGVIQISSSRAANSVSARIVLITVLATDIPLTDPPKTGTVTVNITVFHPPAFTQSSYTFSTPVLGQVVATDLDGDVLTYSFASPQSNFVINSATGAISTTGSLTLSVYTFVVLVTDGVYVVQVNVTINVPTIIGVAITPASSMVNILLDTKNYSVYLSSASIVQDNTANPVKGTAALTAQLNGAPLTPFPLISGCCECAPTCGSAFSLCKTSFATSYNLFSGATSLLNAAAGGPVASNTTCGGDTVYTFNGAGGFTNNLIVESSIRNSLLTITDNFTISMWIQDYKIGSSYILAFEDTSTLRYFHVYEQSITRFAVIYARAAIPGSSSDSGVGTEVEVNFIYDATLSPNGLRDNVWHYITISVNYPVMQFTVDGVVYNIVAYSYSDQNRIRVPSSGVTPGTVMPAPIMNKASYTSTINVRIGGSSVRTPTGYVMKGSIRQMYFTSLMDSKTYSCLASCNNQIYSDGRVPQISTSFNPVSRTLSFSGTYSPSVYTSFLQSLVYADNGYLPPQETGSTRIVTLQIADGATPAATGTATVTITGLSNQFPPVLDANGNLVNNMNYNTTLTEITNPSVSIYDSRVFIYDLDINPYVAWVTVNITNPLQPPSQEYLTLTQAPPSTLTVVGQGTRTITLTSIGQAATNADFITALISIVYTIPNEAVGGVRIIQSTIYDGKYMNQPSSFTYVTVIAIDNPPVLTFRTGVVFYVEGGPPMYIASSATLQDPDNTTLVSANIQLGQVFDVGYEYLSLNLAVAPGVVCSSTPCNGTTLTITGVVSVVAYSQLIRTLQYVNLKPISSYPSLHSRNVTISVSDDVLLGSASIIVNFLPSGQRIAINLNAPNQNYSMNFTQGQPNSIPVVGAITVVDPTVTTLQSVVVSIRNPVLDETLTLSAFLDIPLAVEINNTLKTITFSGIADTSIYLQVLSTVRYFNGEPEPLPYTRYVDFLVDPGGGAPLFAATTNITIINTYANAPVCNPSSSSISILVNTTANTTLYTFSASNPDIGIYGLFQFTTFWGAIAFLQVNSSGTVTLAQSVLTQTIKVFSIFAQVCNFATPAMCSNCSLTVNIIDINHYPPVFDKSSYQVSVQEYTGSIALVTFNITDSDTGSLGQLKELDILSVSPPGCQGHFSTTIAPPSLLVSNLNYSVASYCSLTLQAIDQGVYPSPLSSTAQVNVTVLNTKISFSGNITLTVIENNLPNIQIGSVTTTNSYNITIMYSLLGTSQFIINSQTGAVTILFMTYYKVASAYTFQVLASDTFGRSALANVAVQVTPLGNNPLVLDLNVTDPTRYDAVTPVTFVENSNTPVTLITYPAIYEVNPIPLLVVKIMVTVANSPNPSAEQLSVPNLPPSFSSSLAPGQLSITPSGSSVSNITQILLLLQQIQFLNTEYVFSSCNAALYPCLYGSLSRTILFTVMDNFNTSLPRAAYVLLQPVRHPPVINLNTLVTTGSYIITFIQQQGPVNLVSLSTASITGPDSQYFTYLVCQLTTFDGSSEFLLLNGTLPSSLSVTYLNSRHTVNITGVDTAANYTLALSLIQYNSTALSPNTTTRTVVCFVSDGVLQSNAASVLISYQHLRLAPYIQLGASTASYTAIFTERGGPIPLASSQAVITDTDDTNLSLLNVTLLNAFGPTEVLGLNTTLVSAASLTYIYAYPTLSIRGNATIETYISILVTITYNNTNAEIANTSARQAVFVVADSISLLSSPAYTTINSMPVDNHPPVFVPSNFYSFSVFENATIGTSVGTVSVTDADLPANLNSATFSISFGTMDFALFAASLESADLRTAYSLSYVMRAKAYALQITATSGTYIVEASINVSVINLNLYPPVFVNLTSNLTSNFNSTITVQIYEDTPIGTRIPGIHAVDPDNLNPIVYSLTGSAYLVLTLVGIDSLTGDFIVNGFIDRTNPSLSILNTVVVSASDGTYTSTATVIIEILYLNKYLPAFTSAVYNASVTEDTSPPLTPIVTVAAIDPDEVPYSTLPGFVSKITYSILPTSSYSSSFLINSTTGHLYQIASVSAKQIASFSLVVQASDNDPLLTVLYSNTIVVVQVQHVDNLPPAILTPNNTQIIVPEVTPPISSVYTVLATDPDWAPSLQYLLLGDGLLYFSINSSTGVISSINHLTADGPTPRIFSFTVRVTDNSTSPLHLVNASSSISITIIIADSNTQTPTFDISSYVANISEGLPPNTPILYVHATDTDYGYDPYGQPNGNNLVSYSLLNAQGNFYINSTTGLIHSNATFNALKQAVYTFLAVVVDLPKYDQPRSSTANVTVVILIMNMFPSAAYPNTYVATVPENAKTGDLVSTYAAVQWSPMTSPTSRSPTTYNVGLVAGISIAIVVFTIVAIFVGAGCCITFVKKRQKQVRLSHTNEDDELNHQKFYSSGQAHNSQYTWSQDEHFCSVKDIKYLGDFPLQNLKPESSFVDRGEFGEVFQGTAIDILGAGTGSMPVANKTLHKGASSEEQTKN